MAPHGAAMTANVITYQERLAVREVGKVLGLPEPLLTRMLALSGRHGSLAEGAAAAGLDSASPQVQQLLELCAAIIDLPRHLGQHSGGMVLAAGRLDEVVPLEPASMPGRSVVQWNKDDCADLGLIKVDLLGLGMLNLLTQAVPLVVAHEGVDLDLAHLPADDPKVYAMLRRADTVGVFQVESRAQMNTLPRLRPRCFYDLVVEVALIRPGPIGGKMVHPYLQRRAGLTPVRYTHPCLEPILARTLGVPIFQEQVMRMAMAAAGFNVAPGGRVAPGHEMAHEPPVSAPRAGPAGGAFRTRDRRRGGRRDRRADRKFPGQVRVSRIARGQLRPAGLRLGLFEGASSGGFYLRPAQCLAAGLLPPGHDRQGCSAPRPSDAAS